MLGPDEMSHGFAAGREIKAFIPQMHLASLLSSLKSSYLKIINSSVSLSVNKEMENKGSSQPPVLCPTTKTHKSTTPASSHFYENFEHQTFQRNGWTYHAKGLWFSDKRQGLIGSYIGSSNFGERSWKRDFELGFLFYQRKQEGSSCQATSTFSASSSVNFDSFLKKDYQLLQQHCKKNNLLQNKIASFLKNPSVQQKLNLILNR
jgi:phosphatidylserine/phosphatidylglycerophosphate/cardiolipin synthase-like enzyme